MFKKLFGKKNEGFYLQLEDDTNTPKPPAKAKSQPPATEKAAKAVKPAKNLVDSATAKLDVNADKEAAKSPKEAVKTTKKAESNKKDKSNTKEEAPKAPVVTAPPAPAPVVTTFATDYLIKPSSTSGRRRPGANMNMFLDMARQAKKPANIK